MPDAPSLFDEPVEAPKPDTVADALIQNGLVPNSFLLDLNGALTIPRDLERPYPWSLPSRLFIFPIGITRQLDDGSRSMTLRHPLLTDHPFVKRVEETIAVQIVADDEPDGYGEWWHAVDLVGAGLWRELLDTARFTTPENIAGAVSYGLDYSPHEGKKRNGYISTTEAREIMAALDRVEPSNRDAAIAEHFMRPSSCKSDSGAERWPINTGPGDPCAKAWGHILGIEAGYFAHDRAGFLGWTERGRDRFPPLPRVEREVTPYVPPTPQPSLADEIAPRPAQKTDAQMDLF